VLSDGREHWRHDDPEQQAAQHERDERSIQIDLEAPSISV
jgi:hypothetical protein